MKSSTLAAREVADACPCDGEVRTNEDAITQNSVINRARRLACDFMANEYTQPVIYTADDRCSMRTSAAGT